jgi:arylformamidase
MSFDDLPPLPPLIYPEARGYAERISEASRRVQRERRCVLDVSYGSDYWQKVDIFLPEKPEQSAPVLCFLHGGAWVNGCKEWMGFMAPPLLDLPAVFVSISYRLAPTVRYPDPVEDCFNALAWVHENIGHYGGDPARLHIGGHSAGGHLAALLALRPAKLQAHGVPAAAVKACYPVSGVFDLRPGVQGESPRTMAHAFLGGDALAAEASPICHAGRGVPFLIAFGEHDLPELVVQNRNMIETLNDVGADVKMIEFAGFNHFDTNESCGSADNEWVRTVRDWMQSL